MSGKNILLYFMTRIKHGFSGQRMIILPFHIVEETGKDPLMNDLFLHSLGYFPNARHHYIDRPYGCSEFLLIYCSKGKGWFTIRDERQELSENQFVILPAQTPHRYGADEHDPWTIYWMHFKGSKAALFEGKCGKALFIPPDADSRIDDRIRLFDEMYNVLADSLQPENLNFANLCLAHFMGTLLYVKAYRNSKSKQNFSASLIHLATHYMNENIEKKLRLEDIAQNFGYSPSHFYRLFYKDTGYAPMVYFTQMKILRACYYLQYTSFRVNEIGLKLGFDDPYYFSRTFTRIMGMPPKTYRGLLTPTSDE